MEPFDWKKFLSRKLITTWAELILVILVPIIYQKLGVSNEVQLAVVAAVCTGAGIYKFTNVSEAKGSQGQEPKP